MPSLRAKSDTVLDTAPERLKDNGQEPTESPRSPETVTVRARRTPAAHTSRRAARRTQVISGGRSQWRNRPHGASRGLVNRRWWLRTRTHFLTRTYWRTSRARCATRAAPLRKSRRLAEFGTQRSGLNKNRSHRFCAARGWMWSPHPDRGVMIVTYYWWKTCAIRRKTFSSSEGCCSR